MYVVVSKNKDHNFRAIKIKYLNSLSQSYNNFVVVIMASVQETKFVGKFISLMRLAC